MAQQNPNRAPSTAEALALAVSAQRRLAEARRDLGARRLHGLPDRAARHDHRGGAVVTKPDKRGFLGARQSTWRKWWYIAFFAAVAMLVYLLVSGDANGATCPTRASLPAATQKWLTDKLPQQPERQQWVLLQRPVSQMGPYADDNPIPESAGDWYLPPDTTPPFTFKDEASAASAGDHCKGPVMRDRTRSWPSNWTIVGYRAVMRFCHSNGTVQTHHFNTAIVNCCAPLWDVYETKRITKWVRWRGRPHGAFMGVFQYRAHFCPPFGCVDNDTVTGRIVVHGNGRVHRNTDAAAI